MVVGARVQLKWLEITSVVTTTVMSIAGWVSVDRCTRWSVERWIRSCGCSLPAPTQFVIDLVWAPMSLAGLLLVLPTAIALLGAFGNSRGWRVFGPALLVTAPQLALLETMAGLACRVVPLAAFSPCRAT